jgi:alginate O-acetyltransferase complex protein AlgI
LLDICYTPSLEIVASLQTDELIDKTAELKAGNHMVFSDKFFLFVFLPVTFITFQLTRRFAGGSPSIVVLIAFSCAFYGYWSIPYLGLLLSQILINYCFAKTLSKKDNAWIFRCAVTFNLVLLGYFKYRNFFMENVGELIGVPFIASALVVPLAISFHTFQQIALLADVRDGEAELPPLLNYIFFVVFFPQLIAGPIVLHREMGEQVARARAARGFEFGTLGVGGFLLLFGLFKKVFLADMLAPHIDLAYYPGLRLSCIEAWLAVVGYPLQLYMDFSGYSDMAVGLGLIFGFRLPNNFLLPLRATSMIDYWKRWHITMTRFFTMYVYLPLALSLARWARRGRLNRFGQLSVFSTSVAVPTFVTFLASGLWHGAGWTFIMFGAVNGIGLVVNHYWSELKCPALPRLVGWILTMGTIFVTLVYFRSTSLKQAHYMLGQLFDVHSLGVAPWWLAQLARRVGLPLHLTASGESGYFEWLYNTTEALTTVSWIAILAVLALILPALSAAPEKIRPTWRNAFASAAMILLTLGVLNQPRSFLYFAF